MERKSRYIEIVANILAFDNVLTFETDYPKDSKEIDSRACPQSSCYSKSCIFLSNVV
jgi:hypothetical protein